MRNPASIYICRQFKRKRYAAGLAHCESCQWEPPLPSMWSLLHTNHIVPVCCEGGDEESNLILLCPNHHAIVGHFFGKHTSRHSGKRRYHGPATRSALIAWLKRFDNAPEEVLSEEKRRVSEALETNI